MCSNAHKKYTKSFDSACLLTQFVTSKHESDDILAAGCVFAFHVVKRLNTAATTEFRNVLLINTFENEVQVNE
jgi:hypothetical protein